MEIDPRHLAQLAAIAENGSFSRAANVLNLSQPALSSGIAQLERRLGVRVLERGRYGARLTVYGEALMRHWRVVSSQLKQAAEEMRLRTLGAEGPLAVGVSPVAGSSYVPEAVGRLRQIMPLVSVHLIEKPSRELHAMLREGELDLVVSPVGILPEVPDIEDAVLLHDELGIVVRTGHPRYDSPTLALQDVDTRDWILPTQFDSFRRQVESLFISSNLRWPGVAISANSMTTIKALVRNSDCATIMTRSLITMEIAAGMLRYVDIKGLNTRRSIGYSWLRSRGFSPVTEKFVAILQSVASDMAKTKT
jgi:molybdate transport repressor ModE-like protein